MEKEKSIKKTRKKLGRPGVSREEVHDAIRTLSQEGGSAPTLRRIQGHLGGGSLATISKFRQELADTHEDISEDPLEVAVRDKITVFVRAMHNDANTSADAYADKQTKSAEHSVKVAHEVRDKMRLSRDHIEEKAQKAERQLAGLEKRTEELEQKLANMTHARDKLNNELRACENNLSSSEANYEKDVALLNSSLAHARKDSDEKRVEHERLIDALNDTVRKLKEELLIAKTKLDQLMADFDNMNANYLATQERIKERDRTIVSLSKQTEKLTEWQDSARTERKQLYDENKRLETECKQLVDEKNSMLVNLSKRDVELEAKNSDLIKNSEWHNKIVAEKQRQIADLHKEIKLLKQR